jgi:hypothetical protein
MVVRVTYARVCRVWPSGAYVCAYLERLLSFSAMTSAPGDSRNVTS